MGCCFILCIQVFFFSVSFLGLQFLNVLFCLLFLFISLFFFACFPFLLLSLSFFHFYYFLKNSSFYPPIWFPAFTQYPLSNKCFQSILSCLFCIVSLRYEIILSFSSLSFLSFVSFPFTLCF